MKRLRLDFANCLSDRVGEHGLAATDLEAVVPQLLELTDRLNAEAGRGMQGWRRLAHDPMRHEHLESVRTVVEQLRPRTDNLLLLGIGGSALGAIALHQALTPATYNLLPPEQRGGPRLFVLDNVDPAQVAATLTEIRRTDPGLERTVVNVVSKSGETAETAALFMIVRTMLIDVLGDRHVDHLVATTDAQAGTMRTLCDDAGYTTLPVPEGVGGRFSVLSPVGLFPAAMCGIDVAALLDGAAAMDERCSGPDVMTNPAAVLAWLLVEHGRRGKTNHVLMPYANALVGMADWYRQLWAESLGKRLNADGEEIFAGFTPIRALGATDQHSQIQLYREGPNDKVVGFVAAESFDRDVTIPSGLQTPSLSYLEGRTLSELLEAERGATEFALLDSQRPNFTITLPRLDAHAIGEFIQLWQVTTAYAATLLNINAFDQPAVETGKQATFGLMGREGYEQWRLEVQRVLDRHAFVID